MFLLNRVNKFSLKLRENAIVDRIHPLAAVTALDVLYIVYLKHRMAEKQKLNAKGFETKLNNSGICHFFDDLTVFE